MNAKKEKTKSKRLKQAATPNTNEQREHYEKPTTEKHKPQEFVAGNSEATLYVSYYY